MEVGNMLAYIYLTLLLTSKLVGQMLSGAGVTFVHFNNI